jgi:hypothetical protein
MEAHYDRVPKLAVRAAVVLDAAALLDEAELAVESDRRVVVCEDLQRELVQTLAARLLDRGGEERRPDAAASPRLRDQHPDLTDAEPGGLDVQRADDVAGGDGDDRAVDRGCEPLRPRVDVDRRL